MYYFYIIGQGETTKNKYFLVYTPLRTGGGAGVKPTRNKEEEKI